MNREDTLLVDVRTAAKLLGGLGESTLRRWISRGRVPVLRLGRRVFLRREALDTLIANSERLMVRERKGLRNQAATTSPARCDRGGRP
jgi:excisionase family DNA binding protein